MNATNNLPHRLREKSFRRFEPDIKRIVSEYPNAIEIDTGRLPLSHVTYAARLRDAILSLATYKWKTDIDMEQFTDALPNIVVSHREAKIVAGSRESVKNYIEYYQIPEAAVIPVNSTPIKLADETEKLLVCRLVSDRIITMPFRVYGLTDKDVESLEDNFDVQITKNADNTYTIQ